MWFGLGFKSFLKTDGLDGGTLPEETLPVQLGRSTNTTNTWEQRRGQGGQHSPGLWGLSRDTEGEIC